MVSTARVGGSHSATIPASVDESIAAQARHTNKITIANVSAWLDIEDSGERKRVSTVLYDYFRTANSVPRTITYPVEEAVRTYDFEVGNPETPNDPMEAFMSPLVHEGFVPAITEGNLKAAVQGRVKNIQHKTKFTPRHFVLKAAQEFVDLVIPNRLNLDPYSVEQVMERQQKPSQRAIIENSIDRDRVKLLAFLKREAYSGPKDPRIITADQPKHKLDYAQFIYPAMEVFKTLPFYMSGKLPIDIAQRVADICSRSTNLVNADHHRLDGTISSFAREIFLMIVLKIFRPCYAEEITNLFEKCHQRKIKLAANDVAVEYESFWIILSGMMDTSAFGTLASALGLYTGLRTFFRKREDGTPLGFYTQEEAWYMLENHASVMGDDMIVGSVPKELVETGAKNIGLISEAYNVRRGELGVEFLSRAYGPDVWEGDVTSMTLPRRQLSKLHLTVKLAGVTPIAKLKEKARGYLCSDRHTPVLGDFCRKVEELSDGKLFRDPALMKIEKWQSELDQDVQYPNESSEWMWDVFDRDLPDFDTEHFFSALTNCKQLDDLLVLPCFQDIQTPETKKPVKVDGDVIVPERKAKKKAKPASKPDKSARKHGRRARGQPRKTEA
jgi:hypothetical protein